MLHGVAPERGRFTVPENANPVDDANLNEGCALRRTDTLRGDPDNRLISWRAVTRDARHDPGAPDRAHVPM